MKKKYRFCKYVVVFLSATLFLTGCYSKDNFVHRNPYPYREEPAGNISHENVNKFLSSIKKVDGDTEAKYRMARYFQEKNKHKIAIEELKEIILIDPTFVKAYNALGVSYDQLWDFKNAIHSYKLAIKLDPNLCYVYNNLGFAYLLSGDYDPAIDAFLKAIALDEQNKRFRNNLGLAYAKKGKFELALEQFRLTGDESSANYKLGQILFKEGNYEIARMYDAKSFQTKASTHVTPSVSSAGVEKDSKAKIIRKSIRQESGLAQQQDQTAVKRINSNFNPKRFQSGLSGAPGISENQMFSKKNSKNVNKFSKKKEQLKKKDFTVEVEIEISNGNGVNGMASRLGNYLKQKGFKVTRLKNASCFNHETTKIFYYSSHSQDVSRLLQEIPVHRDKKNVIELEHLGNHIKILIGKDMIPYDSFISRAESMKNPS
jgi:Tfp pilus assembly protein PilF